VLGLVFLSRHSASRLRRCRYICGRRTFMRARRPAGERVVASAPRSQLLAVFSPRALTHGITSQWQADRGVAAIASGAGFVRCDRAEQRKRCMAFPRRPPWALRGGLAAGAGGCEGACGVHRRLCAMTLVLRHHLAMSGNGQHSRPQRFAGLSRPQSLLASSSLWWRFSRGGCFFWGGGGGDGGHSRRWGFFANSSIRGRHQRPDCSRLRWWAWGKRGGCLLLTLTILKVM